MYPHAFFFLSVCLYCDICLHSPVLITPTLPQHKHTHIHPNTCTHGLGIKRKSGLCWLTGTGRQNRAHLENIENRAQKRRKVSVRGEGREERGEARLPLGGGGSGRGATVQLQSAVAAPVHTHAQTETQTTSCHSSPHRARLISCQSLQARPIPGGGRKTE